jgi:hypothetical protein
VSKPRFRPQMDLSFSAVSIRTAGRTLVCVFAVGAPLTVSRSASAAAAFELALDYLPTRV